MYLYITTFRFVLAGITAWGISCGVKDEPGAYASVTEALCFIDWTTKCKYGDKYINFYDYSNYCKHWIEDEIACLTKSSHPKASKYLNKAQDMKQSCINDGTPLIDIILFSQGDELECGI